MRFIAITLSVMLAASLLSITGCSGKSSAKSSSAKSESGKSESGKSTSTAAKTSKEDIEAGKIATALAKLSDEDRAAAEKQKICPVGKSPLGGMGVPVKVTLKDGRTAFICCGGCEKPLRDDPDKWLANLETK